MPPMRFSSPSAVNRTIQSFCSWHPQLDPALFVVERLVVDDREPEFIGIKIECAILICDRNTDEFDLLDHGPKSVDRGSASRPAFASRRTKKPLSIYRYSTRRVIYSNIWKLVVRISAERLTYRSNGWLPQDCSGG